MAIEESIPEEESAIPLDPPQLNWPKYYMEFRRKHGGKPIPYKGKSLFQDGWTYSSTSYEGPEWAPPTDPELLREMKTYYWKELYKQNEHDTIIVKQILRGIDVIQGCKSASIQEIRTFTNHEGRMQTDVEPVGIKRYQEAELWLMTEKAECERELAAI